jgi:hypothetical protein
VEPLRIIETQDGLAAFRGDVCIARENDFTWRRAAEQAAGLASWLTWRETSSPLGDLAVIGGGFACLPRILSLGSWRRFDVYELEVELAHDLEVRHPMFKRAWTWRFGPWEETIQYESGRPVESFRARRYDVIVYDIDDEAPLEVFQYVRTPGGVVVDQSGRVRVP